MKARELSKLQIRAEVMLTLQNLSGFDDISKAEYEKYLNKLKSIKNTDCLLEILVKEFVRVDIKKAKAISFFLAELGNLEKLKDTLWKYIADSAYSDELKNIAIGVLKALGDKSTPEDFLSYLENPDEIIDQETQKLLEVASVNLDAQIDFLDFIFTLSEKDQIDFINSLKKDYPGEYLANILIPALESRPQGKLQEILIEVLGETKTPLAVHILADTLEFSDNEKIKRLAKKSLNLLKMSGVKIEDSKQNLYGVKICRISKIHECYATGIDGAGNQGFIISRIKENEDILMFSVVINDIDGIIDCFGFHGISKSDFSKIIERFNEDSSRIPVPPEYCKHRLKNAEIINKIHNLSMPYEYPVWATLLYDIPLLAESIEEIALKWGKKKYANFGKELYESPDFNYWFLDEEDHPVIKNFLEKIIQAALENKENFIKDPGLFVNWLENEITEIIQVIFDEKWLQIYRKRLLNTAYLLNLQKLNSIRNVASSVAITLNENNSLKLTENPFLRELVRKTIFEGFLRHQHNIDNQKKLPKLACVKIENKEIKKKEIEKINKNCKNNSINFDIIDIINILHNSWQNK